MWHEPPNSFTFVEETISDDDIELFLGPDPLDSTTFVRFKEGVDMAILVAQTGKFPSASQARKNGWQKPVPLGYSEFKIGKNHKAVHLFVLNRIPE